MSLHSAAQGRSVLARGGKGMDSSGSDQGVSLPHVGVAGSDAARHHRSPAWREGKGTEGPAASPGPSLPWPWLLEPGGWWMFFVMLRTPREKPENVAERSEVNTAFEGCVH